MCTFNYEHVKLYSSVTNCLNVSLNHLMFKVKEDLMAEMDLLEHQVIEECLVNLVVQESLVDKEHQGEMAIQEEMVREDKMVHVDLMVETGKMVDRENEVLMDYLVHLELMDNLVLEESLVHLVSVDKMAEMVRMGLMEETVNLGSLVEMASQVEYYVH